MMSKEKTNCGKCGICLSVCPVYKVLMEEQASPRAKIQLIKSYDEGKLPSSAFLKDLVSKCLMCGSCAANCPSGVDHYSRFMDMRTKMVEEHGERMEIRSLVFLLARDVRLKLAAGMARLGQELMPEALQKKAVAGSISMDRFPRLNKKPFRSQVSEKVAARGKVRGTVLYFTGCATQYAYEDTGFSTVSVLTSMGYDVVIPKSQACCGIPMLYHGGEKLAFHNIAENLKCLDVSGVEAVVVDCPTCGAALKNEYPKLAESLGLKAHAVAVSEKVRDFMGFVHERMDYLKIPSGGSALRETVTYHAPCHLKNVFSPSDAVLRRIPEITYVPAIDAMECCGGGGTFFYEYPEISGKMAAGKIENAEKTGAGIWLTDCPVCRINLSGNLKEGNNMEIIHPARYLDKLING